MARITDNRGTTIEVGSKVCYNYMGQVALGTVQSIGKGKWGHTFMIEREYPVPRGSGPYEKPISRVNSPLNLMVIHEPEGTKMTVVTGGVYELPVGSVAYVPKP